MLHCLLMWRVIFIEHDIYGREELEYSLVLRYVDDSNGFFEGVGMLRKHSEIHLFGGEDSGMIVNPLEPTGVCNGVEERTVVLV